MIRFIRHYLRFLTAVILRAVRFFSVAADGDTHVDMDERHIRNLTVLLDRKELLKRFPKIDRGDSVSCLEQYDDHYFDWIYIDTDHSYESTKRALDVSERKVKPGGLIAGHDYTTGNITSGIKYGVILAVHEFCVERSWEMIYITHEKHRSLSFCLSRLSS